MRVRPVLTAQADVLDRTRGERADLVRIRIIRRDVFIRYEALCLVRLYLCTRARRRTRVVVEHTHTRVKMSFNGEITRMYVMCIYVYTSRYFRI